MARIIDAFTQFFDGAGDPLVDGFLQFIESGTNNTPKNTFKDVNLTIANANPVPLDGEGRCPNVFGTGVYKVILFANDGLGNPGQQIQPFDPVGGSLVAGQWDDWQPGVIYDSGFIVTGSDKKNYRSIVDGNLGNDPALSANPEEWEELQLGRVWNEFIDYSTGNSVFGSNGDLFKSLVSSNLGNDPVTDTGENWTQISASASSAEQFNYSEASNVPASNVVSLNPSSSGIVLTLTSSVQGDVKRLINISAFDAIVKLTGTGFLTIPAGETAFTFRVVEDWYSVNDTNETLVPSILTLGMAEVFNSGTSIFTSTAKLTSSKIAVSFRNSALGSFGTAVIGDITGSSIVFGSLYAFDGTIGQSEVARLTDSKIAIAYDDTGNGNFGTVIIGDISGTVITYGSEYVFNSGSSDKTSITALTSTKIAIAYKDIANGSFGTAIIGDVSGTVVTLGLEYVFNAASTNWGKISRITDSKIGIAYSDVGNSSFGTAIIGDITGTVIAYGSEYVFNSGSTDYTDLARISDTKIAISYSDAANIGISTAIIGDITGTVIAYGTEVPFSSGLTSYNSIDIIAENKIAVSYVDNANSSFGTVAIGVISGNIIVFSSPIVFNSGSTLYTSIASTSDNNFAISYRDDANSNFGTTIIGQELTA